MATGRAVVDGRARAGLHPDVPSGGAQQLAAPVAEVRRAAVPGLATMGRRPRDGGGSAALAYEEAFDGASEHHRLWVEQVDGQVVVMVASDPITVSAQLHRWEKAAAKGTDERLRSNILQWIATARKKIADLVSAAQDPDSASRQMRTTSIGHELTEVMKKLWWAFDLGLADLGVVAVYRGLHFTTDWQAKRGRTVAEEGARGLDEVKGEGAYSQATWEIATRYATAYNEGRPATKRQLEVANEVVKRVLATWSTTTDANRQDEGEVGTKARADRARAQNALDHFARQAAVGGPPAHAVAGGIWAQGEVARQGVSFTQSGTTNLANQFMAAVSRYIDSQSYFERELQGKELITNLADNTTQVVDRPTAYTDLPFTSIPFLSTSKDAGEAVKYAQGKLATATKNTVGVVGRVLVYVAPHADILKAGGIDVWEELQQNRLNFTTYRKSENEITFSGQIPDHFLKAMTPVTAHDTVDDNARLAEVAAFRAAAPFGGLKPLPRNTD